MGEECVSTSKLAGITSVWGGDVKKVWIVPQLLLFSCSQNWFSDIFRYLIRSKLTAMTGNVNFQSILDVYKL